MYLFIYLCIYKTTWLHINVHIHSEVKSLSLLFFLILEYIFLEKSEKVRVS